MELIADYEIDHQMASLVQSALHGDRDALVKVLSCQMDRLYHVAIGVLGRPEDAEDALQDGMLAAVRNLNRFEGRSAFSTWLNRIVFNAALMRLRTMRAHAITSIDAGGLMEGCLPLSARIADPRPDPEEAYAQGERLEILDRCLEKLPATYRSALWLKDLRGMTIQETAEVLALSQGALKSRLHRARARVSENLRDISLAQIHESSKMVYTKPKMRSVTRNE